MNTYREEILSLWEENKNNPLFKYSPLTKIPDCSNKQSIILGINPSNSFTSLTRVIKENSEKWRSNETLSTIVDSNSYNNFLLYDKFKTNEQLINEIQNYCHNSHSHFIKQRKFLEQTNVDNYDFFDVFPIWEISQNKLIENLSKYSKIENSLLNIFLKFIEREKVNKLIFLNKGSFDIFHKRFKHQIKIDKNIKVDTGGKNKRILISGKLQNNNHHTNLYVVGIGGRNNNNNLIKEINKIQFFKL